MPTRSQLLTTAAVVSLLTFGIIRYACGDAADGTASPVLAGLSPTRLSGVPAHPPGGRHGERDPASGHGESLSHTGDSHQVPRTQPLGTTNSGRGIFQAAGSSSDRTKPSHSPDLRNTAALAPPGHVSEAELQWRAARVEQEANHELKRLVTLLDLSEDQQDRIFQTLARRSADWHPLMQPAPAIGGGGHGVADNGGNISQPPSTPTDPGETTSPRDSGAFIAPPPPTQESGQVHHDNPGTTPQPGSGTPLTDDLAPDLTPSQQEELAQDEMQRQEWWESIIPRLLPDEEDDEIHASPPDALTDGAPDPGSPPSQ